MNTEPKTIKELKAENDKLKADQLELEEQLDVAKRIIGRYKRKYGSLDDKPPQQITKPDFGG